MNLSFASVVLLFGASSFLVAPPTMAWVTMPTTRRKTTTANGGKFCPSSSSSTRRYNIPPPAESNTVEFAAYASQQSPPASFFELQKDCVRAARLAMRDGVKLMEIEFPPLPAAVLEMDDVSAYDVATANLKLATDFAKGLLASTASSSSSSASSDSNEKDSSLAVDKITILLPDEAERDFCIEKAGGTANPYPGISISSLRVSDPNDDRLIKPEQVLLNLFNFGKGSGGLVQAVPGTDVYIILTASAQELPDIEELHTQLDQDDATIICFNLKLDTLRGDLGAPAFPSKDFQDRFLSKVKPVYYLRTRQYSRSTTQPPFMVNFQGCLFRSYPGEYQTLLDTGKGRYRRLEGRAVRPGLGEFKEQLVQALQEQGVLQDEGSTIGFLRTGYKTTTWWEEDRPEAHDDWKT